MTAATRPIALASPIMTCVVNLATIAVLVLSTWGSASAHGIPRTLVVVVAHGDDEGAVAPILARYAREGVDIYLIIATDGAQGGAHTSIPRGAELARVRAEETRCAAMALGIHPPILLGFPDGKLGDYTADPSLLYRLTAQLAEEFGRLRPDAVITWGPDGGTGHPDHRLVSGLVTQLLRARAPGLPERLFYMNLPVEGIRAMNSERGEPPLLVPEAKYFSVYVPFAAEDLAAAARSMGCHRTQFTEEIGQRVLPAMRQAWNGTIPLAPLSSASGAGTDVFQ